MLGFTEPVPQNIPEKGVPLLRNFTPIEYNHQGKIWDIDTAPNGIVYMAADKGLLEYDGSTWNSFSGSDGITRSIYIVNDSLIYTGSDLDFGVWKKNVYQQFEYTSLYPFREDLVGINEEFWKTFSIGDNIFFISADNIYVYKDENLTKIPAINRIESSFVVNDKLYFTDQENGLYLLEDLSPKHVSHFPKGIDFNLSGIYELNDEMVLVTKNSGLLRLTNGEFRPVSGNLSNKLKAANVFSFERIGDSYLTFGTILDGVFITDLDGDVIHHINRSKGLQNNTVLSMHHSSTGKLWLGMDYGVSFLDLNNEITFFYDFNGGFGTGHTAVLDGDTFYLGTNQGLYKANWNDLDNKSQANNFELIPGSEGQVWTLKIIDGQLLIGHDRGLFTLQNGRFSQLNNQQGFWTIQPYKDYLLAGTYTGILIFRKQGNRWVYQKQMELILGACNQVLIEGDNTIWVNIPNYGIIKADLNEDLYPDERQIFLKETFGGDDHYLKFTEDGVFVVTDELNYVYDSAQNIFTESTAIDFTSEVDDLIQGFLRPLPINSDFEFLPVYNGFALRDLTVSEVVDESPFRLVFRSIEAFNNRRRMHTYGGAEVPHDLNNILVESIVANQGNVLYQYSLNGSSEWSEWSPESTFELIGLDYGEQQVNARAMVNGVVTPAETIRLSIAIPWYLMWYAKTFYLLLGVSVIYMVYVWRQVSMKKLEADLLLNQEQSLQEQEQKHQKELRRLAEASLEAEIDRVKGQLKSKTIELATKAKENEEINEVLLNLKEKVKRLEQNPESLKSRSAEILYAIDSHISSEDNTFEIQMDELHQEFFKKLKHTFPDLTSNDLRLCAYLKIGFNSKEISELFKIKPSSVYISRSRLRKKLNMESDDDLHGYLNSI